MILSVGKVNSKKSFIRYCIKPIGNSEFMKGYVVIDEWDNISDLLFKISESIIGKWIDIDITFKDIKNNHVREQIKESIIEKYVL